MVIVLGETTTCFHGNTEQQHDMLQNAPKKYCVASEKQLEETF